MMPRIVMDVLVASPSSRPKDLEASSSDPLSRADVREGWDDKRHEGP